MTTPEISVVMGVHNGGEALAATVESVRSQQGVDLEFVVVDDGSTDGTAAVLGDFAARDARIRVLTQEHGGLTRALIRGCAAARGALVARQDAGDLSLPERLRLQRDLLLSDPKLVFVACGWETVGPGGELLERSIGEERAAATARLRVPDERTLGNPPHPTVMFRRDAYEAVGGYRTQFAIGQDVDLWVRLAARGDLASVPRVLYQVRFSLDGISARRVVAQQAVRRLIVAAARAAARGESEDAVLSQAQSLGRGGPAGPAGSAGSARGRARAAYFVAACLRRNGNVRAAHYYREALRANPLHLKALAGWLLALRPRRAARGAADAGGD